MPVEKKPRAKAVKKVSQPVQSDSDSDTESVQQITLQLQPQSPSPQPQPQVSLSVSESEQQIIKKTKAYNAELFKLLDTLNKNKQNFQDAIESVETYNYDKFSDQSHKFEQMERDFVEKNEILKKTFEDTQTRLSKEFAERKYKSEKEHVEKIYELDKTYQEKKYNFEHSFQKTIDEMEKKKRDDAYAFSTSTLKQHGETSIKVSELNEKNLRLENMSAKHDAELKELTNKLNIEHAKELKNELERIVLKNKSDLADLTAQNQQKDKQIVSMQETIATLKNEITEQRNLTKHVAEAGRQGQIVQNLSGKNS